MINELDKNILKKIIVAEHPISGADISRMCHISINTLRKEINIINDFLLPHGCHIDTRIAIGYSLVIDDESKAAPFIYRLLKDINRYGYLNISDSKKENYIIRRLLSSNSMISIETLINELYCSKSTILRKMERISNYLNNFDLEIKVKRNVGFYIDGKEWNKRMCLVHQHKIYKHSSYNDLNEEIGFNTIFLNNTDYPNEIRSLFLSLVPLYPSLSFSHIDLPTIFNFIILCKTRHDKTNELTFTEKQLRIARTSSTYKLAKDMINAMPSYFQNDFGEKECDAIAILLTGLRKYNIFNHLEDTAMERLKRNVNEILLFISERFMIEDVIDETLIQDLCFFIKEQENLHLFEIYKDDENFSFINCMGIFSSDICARLAYYMETQKGIKLNLDSISRAYSIFNRALFKNRYFFNKQNILVISRYSTYFANNIATRIKNIYYNKIGEIHVCEYTDIPTVGIDNYDVIITDINSSLISIGMPIVEIDFNRNNHDFKAVDNYFNNIYNKYTNEIFKKEYFSIQSFTNKSDVLEFIYESLNLNDISKESWIEDCLKRDYYVTFEREKEIVLITNLTYDCSQPQFRLFISRESFIWNNQSARIFIYYNHGPGLKKDIQLISYLIKQFLHKPEQYLNSLENLTYEEIINNFENQ